MTNRVYNFSAGPAMLPLEVLEASAKALVDFQGKGFGIAECSHRGKEFDAVIDEAILRCKGLLGITDSHEVLFLQGGATQMFSTIPMNLLGAGTADYVVNGEWSKKAADVATAAHGERIRIVASSEAEKFARPAAGWSADAGASYLHLCSNETVHGHRLVELPRHPALIIDASSEIMSRPHPMERIALMYAGAQKNLGPSGVVLAIVRKDLLERVPKTLAKIFSLKAHAEAKSCLNTPPTFGVYMLLETFRWLERQGGLGAMEKRNAEKAQVIYDAIDRSKGYYRAFVTETAARSHMNICFHLPSEEKTEAFLKEAGKRQLMALKGYRTVGGVRASIYNAMPLAGCQALATLMQEFSARNP